MGLENKMTNAAVTWTIDDVASRFHEATITARRLPPVRVQGYFNTWPPILRQRWEWMGDEERTYRPAPPCPETIDRMIEVMNWIQWIETEQRHLVWMRADGYRWRDIARRLGCDRTTAWRRWQLALLLIADHLNARELKEVLS
jgi:hypothetical protein